MNKFGTVNNDYLMCVLLFVIVLVLAEYSQKTVKQRRLTLLNNGYNLLRMKLKTFQQPTIENFNTTVSCKTEFYTVDQIRFDSFLAHCF